MNRFALKNRLTLSLGIGIASVALIAGCADDGDDNNVGIVPDTTPVATETMNPMNPTAVAPGAATTPGDMSEDVDVRITASGLMADGMMSDRMVLTTGSTVTFTNDTASTVEVTTDDGAIDEEVDAGDSFDFTFSDAGTWIISVDGVEMGTVTVS
jgi:plastocyanin